MSPYPLGFDSNQADRQFVPVLQLLNVALVCM